jgi:hypothetical protein
MAAEIRALPRDCLDPWQTLIVVLMRELSLAADSNFAPYLRLLPRRIGSPLFWPVEESRALLQGTALQDAWCEASAVADAYEQLRPLLRGWRRGGLRERGCSSRRSFARCGALVRAYAFSEAFGSDKVAMVPMADVLNHRVRGATALLRPAAGQGGGMSMRTTSRVGPGRQLWNSYGELGTADLLRRYGFCGPDNPHDAVHVGLRRFWAAVQRALGEEGRGKEGRGEGGRGEGGRGDEGRGDEGREGGREDSEASVRAACVVALGVPVDDPDAALELRAWDTCAWPLALRVMARAATAPATAIRRWLDDGGDADEDAEDDAGSGGNGMPAFLRQPGVEPDAPTEAERSALRAALDDRLARYPTTVSETAQRLEAAQAASSSPAARRRTAALTLRLREQRMLEALRTA